MPTPKLPSPHPLERVRGDRQLANISLPDAGSGSLAISRSFSGLGGALHGASDVAFKFQDARIQTEKNRKAAGTAIRSYEAEQNVNDIVHAELEAAKKARFDLKTEGLSDFEGTYGDALLERLQKTYSNIPEEDVKIRRATDKKFRALEEKINDDNSAYVLKGQTDVSLRNADLRLNNQFTIEAGQPDVDIDEVHARYMASVAPLEGISGLKLDEMEDKSGRTLAVAYMQGLSAAEAFALANDPLNTSNPDILKYLTIEDRAAINKRFEKLADETNSSELARGMLLQPGAPG